MKVENKYSKEKKEVCSYVNQCIEPFELDHSDEDELEITKEKLGNLTNAFGRLIDHLCTYDHTTGLTAKELQKIVEGVEFDSLEFVRKN